MTMKKQLLFLLLLLMPLVMQAQQTLPKFGYFKLTSLMKAIPDYAVAQKNMADLSAKYDAETKREESEFNKKYEEFLDGQRDFAPSILRKRQAELQDLLEKNVAFKNESIRLLQQAETNIMLPIKNKVLNAAYILGKERGYAFILNADNDALPYIDVNLGDNIEAELLNRLTK